MAVAVKRRFIVLLRCQFYLPPQARSPLGAGREDGGLAGLKQPGLDRGGTEKFLHRALAAAPAFILRIVRRDIPGAIPVDRQTAQGRTVQR